MENLDLTKTEEPKERKVKKYNVIACKCCSATNITLIKAEDSYYCKFCFNKLGLKKYIKKGRK